MGPGVREFVKEAGLESPIVYDDKGVLFDAFGAEQLPQTYVLDRRGRILMDVRRYGEGASFSSWESPRLGALLRMAREGVSLGLPPPARD